MTRYKIIVNPTSGRGQGGQAVDQLHQLLKQKNMDYELILTEKPWHAADLARQAVADGFDVVVSVGGDGTANEVLNGLMRARQTGIGTAAMSVICIGRGNDFAFGVNIPLDFAEAVDMIAADHRQLIDVGLVKGGDYPDGRFFGNGVGIGFDAVVGFEALKMKRLTGFLSYIVAAIKTIFIYAHPPIIQLTFNDTVIQEPFLMVSIMNGRRMGGGFMMAPEGQVDDGDFDLCIASKVKQIKIPAVILRFIQGTQASHPAIRMARCQQLKATAINGSIPAHADGETLCVAGQELTFEILSRQIEMICPAEVDSK